jgi:hypothetical protein
MIGWLLNNGLRCYPDFYLDGLNKTKKQLSILSCDGVTTDGNGLVSGFIEHLQIVTSNCSAIANSHTLQFTTACTKSSHSAVSPPVVAWSRLPTADVPLPLRSQTIPVPQLPASHSNSSQGLNRSGPVTHLLSNQVTPLHCTLLHYTH